jgi:TonB family protein
LSITPLHPQDTVRRLTSDEAIRAATAKPQPDYPPVARQLRIQGRVDVEVSIDPTGTVESTRIVAGNAALTGTIANTLKRWHFEPALVDGKPVRAIATISFTFKL